jgi:RecB family exonuclease
MLYATDEGQPITTQSMIKAFRNCPRQAMYKYMMRLKPKTMRKPLTRGKWFHALLEAYYQAILTGADPDDTWKKVHQRWTYEFSKLFDEEKEELGDLPREMRQLFTAYLWHYGDPQYADYRWNVKEVEFTVETELPNGHLFRGRVDLLVEDDYGIWAVDHKTHRREPQWDQRMFDEQGPMYVWALRAMGIPVRGFIWNYVITESISQPRVVKDGSRFYAKMGASEYLTYVRAVKAAQREFPGIFLADEEQKVRVRQELVRLKAQRWVPGQMQTSPHFRRELIEKDQDVIARVVAGACVTSDRMHAYDFSDPDLVERNTSVCRFCDYKSLSLGDLLHGDSKMIQKREFKSGQDPLAYYGDEEERF